MGHRPLFCSSLLLQGVCAGHGACLVAVPLRKEKVDVRSRDVVIFKNACMFDLRGKLSLLNYPDDTDFL